MKSTRSPIRATLFRVGILALLLGLWGYAASDRGPMAMPATARAAEVVFAPKDGTFVPGAPSKSELAQLRIFNHVVLLVKENYVDPKRIDPRKMLSAALGGVERQVAEVMVDGDEKAPKIKVTVDKVSKEFDVANVSTLWQLSYTLRDVFEFIDQHLTDRDDLPDIEYAAANGMLSTLDPHSILMKPENFKEMRLHTKGEFGGVGFVIQMREGNLTVVKVLKATPAQKAGIKSKDVISRIGNESTINMDLNEAVGKLRGKPGSEISLHVMREGWPAAKPITLTRAIINVESVDSKLLADDVGYISLKGFQGNTARDLYREYDHLKALAKPRGGLKGIVLDLRNNPGGLLDQAVQVSDAFLSDGSIVTTVSKAGSIRDERRAKFDENDIALPLVVLVNSNSASASEIVAGAIKNDGRGLIVGRPTFGKGSVQVLHDDFKDESALKLTVAQYLTPGDLSIQETGITPDIELIPSRISAEKMDMFAPKKAIGEADLDRHLGNPDSDKVAAKRDEVVRKERPLEEIRFLRDPPKEKPKDFARREIPDRDDYELDDQEGVDPDTDEIVEDYQIRFARDLVLAAPFVKRDQQLKAARAFLDERKRIESARMEKAIEALQIPWSTADVADAPGGLLSFTVKPGPDQKVAAGDTLAWTATATNVGTGPFLRLRAYTESDNPFLDRREFVFGNLKPGETRSWTVNVKLAKDLLSRRDNVTFKLFADGKSKPEDAETELNILELPRPSFAYNWQLVDHCETCNGDGIVQPGETIDLAFEVKNVGSGEAFETIAMLRNKGDESLVLSKGRYKIGTLAPGEAKRGVFTFEVARDMTADNASLLFTIIDDPTDELLTDKLTLPVSRTGAIAAKPPGKAGAAMGDIAVRAFAGDDAPIVARASKDKVFALEGKSGDWLRVKDGDVFGFVSLHELRIVPESSLRKASAAAKNETVERRSEPTIRVAIDAGAGGIVTDSARYSLSGEATSAEKLRDLYIFVNDEKVFYKLSSDTRDGANIRFDTEFPLKLGNNTVLIVAREDKDFMARKALMITRREPEMVQAKPEARTGSKETGKR